VWAVHAGIDWDWEMPAATLWFVALAATACAARPGPARSPQRRTRVAVGLGLLVLAVLPAQVSRSQDQLDGSVRAFRVRDCPTAIDRALNSIEAVGARAEPWEILAYCNVGAGRLDLAERAADRAVDLDPDNWEFHYVQALVRGAAGHDPRSAARRALELNPFSDLAAEAIRAFATSDPRRWQASARRLRLAIR